MLLASLIFRHTRCPHTKESWFHFNWQNHTWDCIFKYFDIVLLKQSKSIVIDLYIVEEQEAAAWKLLDQGRAKELVGGNGFWASRAASNPVKHERAKDLEVALP